MRIYFSESLARFAVAFLLMTMCVAQTGCSHIMPYNTVYLLDARRLNEEIAKTENGNKLAAREVYLHYKIGLCDRNPEKTFYWLQKAASLGDVPSQYNFGVFYESRGNIVEAEKWYHRASDAGDEIAGRRLLQLKRQK